MKRKLLNIMAMLFAASMLAIPAEAAEYGVIYDETEMLYTEKLELLGTETLPQFTEKYGIDVRVDVLKGIGDFSNVEEAAAGLYDAYDYGSGDGRNGVSLTLLVYDEGDGYGMNSWYVYFAGESSELTENGPQSISSVGAYLSEEAWSGDLWQDAEMLANAAEAMVTELEAFVLSGGVSDTIWSPAAEEEVITSLETEEMVTVEAPAETDWMSGEAQLDHVTDSAGLLTEEQWQKLEKQARAIEEEQGFGVYAVIVNNFTDYADGSVQDAAEAIYQRYSLGTGEGKEGLLLLLSMSDRDYSLITHGSNGNYAFNDAGRIYLTEYFLDDFAENDWYAGLEDYFTWSSDYLNEAEEGAPYSEDKHPMTSAERTLGIVIRVLIILVVPLVIAAIYISILSSKMKSVAEETKAAAYVAGDVELRTQIDQFIRATETRTKISKDSGGGSSRSGGSSGFSGTSGKF